MDTYAIWEYWARRKQGGRIGRTRVVNKNIKRNDTSDLNFSESLKEFFVSQFNELKDRLAAIEESLTSIKVGVGGDVSGGMEGQ